MIDSFFGLLTPAQWDAWRAWLTTLGGFVALFVATGTYLRNGKIRREEQARLVYSNFTHVEHHDAGATFSLLPNGARMGNGTEGAAIITNPDSHAEERSVGIALQPLIQATVTIHNGSKELIGPARVQMVNGGTGHTWDQFSIQVGAIDPESDYVVDFTWINEVHPAQPGLATTLIFRDASGQWWRRHRSEPVERVHDDPENSGPTRAERVRIRLHQENLGIPAAQQIQEPKVSPSVRLQRLWRSCTGRTPTP